MLHAIELAAIVGVSNSAIGIKGNGPIFVVVTDGGPDHCLTYVSVKLSYLALLLHLKLDMLVAA